MTVLLSPQIEDITENASNSSSRATISLKGEWCEGGVRWLPNAGFIPSCTDVFRKPVPFAGVSIVGGSAGHG